MGALIRVVPLVFGLFSLGAGTGAAVGGKELGEGLGEGASKAGQGAGDGLRVALPLLAVGAGIWLLTRKG